MITSSQIHKKLFELKENPAKSTVLVLNICETAFEFATFTSEPFTITKIGEVFFPEDFKDAGELTGYFTQFVNEYNLNTTKYETVYVNWINKHFTLVPSSFYSPDKSKELLSFNIGETNNETILTNEVLGEIKLVYSLPTELKQNIDKNFPHHSIHHSGYNSIHLFFSHYQLKNCDVFLNIHSNQIELLIKKDKKLLMYNVFSCKSNEDILYYLMFSIEQFNLTPTSLKLAMAGNRETGDELFITIKKYIKNVDFVNSDKIIVRKEAFESIPNHYYFSLLNRLLCA